MTLHAFGDDAARIAVRNAGDATVVACEPPFAQSALFTALALRRKGEHFLASVHLEDERTRLLRAKSVEACATYATWDEVRLVLQEYADSLAGAASPLDGQNGANLHEFIRLSDRLIVRSWDEYGRIARTLGSVPRETDIVTAQEPSALRGDTAAADPTDIVVFAPHVRADALGTILTALNDVELPVTVIAADDPTIPNRLRFVRPGGAASALARARVIVDATSNDPGVALALASWQRPLAVSSSGGATEALNGLVVYEPWNRRGILAAVASALSAEAPELRPGRATGTALPSTPPRVWSGATAPLVSVVVPTFNRPALLTDTLGSIARQTYPAIEIIVVNDAGTDVADVVAGFSRARLLTNASNSGPSATRNAGLHSAIGEYVVLFDDDDEMFPDHIASLVHALERTQLDVAYGQMINGFVIPAGNGRWALDRVVAHDAVLDHADIQWAGSLATTALMFRRRVLERIGYMDEAIVAAEDYEFWLRLAAGREWARVDDVTSMYYVRSDGSNRSSNAGERYFAAHQTIYAKHPSARPLVQAGRAAMLEVFGRAAASR